MLSAIVCIDAMEFCVVDLDFSANEIAGVGSRDDRALTNSQSLVNCAARGVVDLYYRVSSVHAGIPAGNGSVFGCEQKDRTVTGADFKRAVEGIKDCSGGCRCPAFSIRQRNRDDQALCRSSGVVQG